MRQAAILYYMVSGFLEKKPGRADPNFVCCSFVGWVVLGRERKPLPGFIYDLAFFKTIYSQLGEIFGFQSLVDAAEK